VLLLLLLLVRMLPERILLLLLLLAWAGCAGGWGMDVLRAAATEVAEKQ
jgi:hypothetical protein